MCKDNQEISIYYSKKKLLTRLIFIIFIFIFLIYGIFSMKKEVYDFVLLLLSCSYFIFILGNFIKSFRLFNKKIPLIILTNDCLKIYYKRAYLIYNWQDFIKIEERNYFAQVFIFMYDFRIHTKCNSLNNNKIHNFDIPFTNFFSKEKIMIHHFIDTNHSYEEISSLFHHFKTKSSK